MADEFVWTGAAGDHNFGDGGNWIDENTGFSGEPGSSDVAVLETSGPLSGSGTVNALDLVASGGTLTTQDLAITASSMALIGTIDLASGTQFTVADSVVQANTSTVIQSDGTTITISGNDGTAGDVVTAMMFGQTSGDKVTYELTGVGTTLDATDGNITVGGGGTAKVSVMNGATLEADDTTNDGSGNLLIAGTGATAYLTVSGAYSTIDLAGALDIGEGGVGHFTLSAGAQAALGVGPYADGVAMVVGSADGGSGTALITGTGTRLESTTSGGVLIGVSGIGTMTISAGATANFGLLTDGFFAAGSLIVTGKGTVLQLHQGAVIGQDATGKMQVLAGAHVGLTGSTSDVLQLGYLAGATGTLLISGVGTVVSADNNQVQIGYSGTGSATVSAGAVLNSGAPVTSASHTAAFIGTEQGSVGKATVTDAKSSWTAHGEFDVGYYGTGTLVVENGGSVTSGNYDGNVGFVEGDQSGSSGTVTVTGTGSKLTNSGRFIVGEYGSGTLTIAAGASVTTSLPAGSSQDGAIIGGASGGTGHVTLTGTGSSWTVGTDLVVGDAGTGALTIGAKTSVKAASLFTGITGTASVSLSSDATLTVSGNAQFGDLATSTVAVGSGAVLSVGGAGELVDGSIALASGKLSVIGAMSVDSGQSISGHGTILTGSLVNTGTVQASAGTLTVTGAVSGTGKLDIASSSTLALNNAIGSGQEADFLAGSGTLTLASAGSFAGTVADFVHGNTIDLLGISTSSLSYSGQTLTLHETGGTSLGLTFAGTYTNASFGLGSDGHGGTLISHT